MKKKVIIIGVLFLAFLSFYLLLGKDVLKISEVDFYNYLQPRCKNGQLEFDFPGNEKSSYEHHYALLKLGKSEKIIPLTLVHDKSGKFFRPRDTKLGCLKDVTYSEALSFKNKVSISDLRVLDSKITDMKPNEHEYECVGDKFVLTTKKLTSKSVDLGGVEMELFAEREREIDILSTREFTVTLNGVPYLFISLTQIECESMDRGNLRGSIQKLNRAISIINLKESKLIGTKRTGVKRLD